MTAQALYLKWRSQTFEEVIGQEHVTRTLRNALERGRMAHAYLFCGPRGTGKTSTARILAKAVNCEAQGVPRPCNQCAICLSINDGSFMDLIEIDAASNTSVDNVRDLRDKVGFRPNQGSHKVYVIDEVHMLSNAAFNALLKTLEEPPPHVLFVLATTEPHKIPATIISRCQRFDFRFVPTTTILDHLRRISEMEGLKIEDDALHLIASHAGGAVRDAVTLLDQLTAYGDVGIAVEHVQSILGLGSHERLGDFVDALVQRDLSAGLTIIDRIVDEGVHIRQFNTELLEYLRGIMLSKAGGELRLLGLSPDSRQRLADQAGKVELAELVRFLRLFSEAAQALRYSLQPQLPLELAFLEAVSGGAVPEEAASAPLAALEPRPAPSRDQRRTAIPAQPKPAGDAPDAARMKPVDKAPVPSPEAAKATPGGEAIFNEVLERWQEILRLVRPIDKEAEAFLRSAQPVDLDGDTLLLMFRHEFHKTRFESQGCQSVTCEAIEKVIGRKLLIRCSSQTQKRQPANSGYHAGGGEKPLATTHRSPGEADVDAGPDRDIDPRSDHRTQRTLEAKMKESPSPSQRDSISDDPLVKAAVDQLGARVTKVTPHEPWAEAPPPEEPPPFEDEL